MIYAIPIGQKSENSLSMKQLSGGRFAHFVWNGEFAQPGNQKLRSKLLKLVFTHYALRVTQVLKYATCAVTCSFEKVGSNKFPIQK